MLIKWDDGYMSGRYWDTKTQKSYELNGEAIEGNKFQLFEGSFGKETGIFEGQLIDSSIFQGTWKSISGKSQLPFEFRESFSAEDTVGWSGNWYFNDVWDNGILMIGNLNENKFDFALSITRGGHQGSIQGIAKVKNRTATFSTTEFDNTPCQLDFIFKNDHIELVQNSSNFSCGFGARAFAGGKYNKIYQAQKAFLSYGIGPENVFPDLQTHDAFLKMVGQEAYHLFAFNMLQTQVEITDPKDKLEATAISGFIPGSISTNEAIIMYDKRFHFWAATLLHDHKTGELVILYFTNDKTYKEKMPHTFETWRASFPDLRVIFQ